MGLDDFSCNRKTHTQTFFLGGVFEIKNPSNILRRDSNPGIPDSYHRVIGAVGMSENGYCPVAINGFHGIFDEIKNCLMYSGRVHVGHEVRILAFTLNSDIA